MLHPDLVHFRYEEVINTGSFASCYLRKVIVIQQVMREKTKQGQVISILQS